MKYTGINPSATNRIASGSLGVFVENTRVGTFGTDSLVVSGSTILSSSLEVIGEENLTGSLNVSGSSEIIGALNTIGEFLVTGSSIISSSLSVVGSSTISGSLSVEGPTNINGATTVTGSAYVTGTTDVLTAQGSIADGTLFNVLGTSGQLFTVTDGLSGSLFSVNTISGLPVVEAFSDFSFVAGQFGVNNLFVKDGKVGIMTGTPQATLDVAGNVKIQDNITAEAGLIVTGSSILSGSISITAPTLTVNSPRLNVGDNLIFSGSTVITGSLTIPQEGDTDLLKIGGTTSAPTLLVGTNNKVNIGTTSSVSTLNVAGTTNVLTVEGTTVEGNMFDVYGPSGQLFSVVDGLSGSLFSVNTISGVPVMEVFSDNTINIGQYSNPPLVVSGPDVLISGSTTVNNHNLTVNSGSIIINKSGSGASDPLFDVEGAQGQLFSVIDSFSGSLMSVNDISGFPILEVFSDDKIVMGTFGSDALVVDGTQVAVGVTSSGTPSYSGLRDGEFTFGTSGGTHYLYVWMAGSWRSSSLA